MVRVSGQRVLGQQSIFLLLAAKAAMVGVPLINRY